jgi:hypothetical protein
MSYILLQQLRPHFNQQKRDEKIRMEPFYRNKNLFYNLRLIS